MAMDCDGNEINVGDFVEAKISPDEGQHKFLGRAKIMRIFGQDDLFVEVEPTSSHHIPVHCTALVRKAENQTADNVKLGRA